MRAAPSFAHFDFAARFLSVVGSPPLLALPTAFLAGLSGSGYPSTLLSIIELLISACVLPSAFTLALFRSGRTSTLDLRERAERLLPSIVTAAGCAAAWVLMWQSGAPRRIADLAIGIALQMALLALLTTRWKVSYHAASACALVVVSRSVAMPLLTVALLALACCIGWARVYQRRHTIGQVTAGALTTVPIAVVMW